MIKSIFFRALTLLGLTFVLIGCGAADPGEGGTGTGTGTPGAAGITADDVKDMIAANRGRVDETSPFAVAVKIIEIMNAGKIPGSCSLFSADGLGLTKAAGAAATAAVTTANLGTLNVHSVKSANDGSFTQSLGGGATNVLAATSFGLETDATVNYDYKDFSLDGKYKLTGKLTMKNGMTANATAPTALMPGYSAAQTSMTKAILTGGGTLTLTGPDGFKATMDIPTTFKVVTSAVATTGLPITTGAATDVSICGKVRGGTNPNITGTITVEVAGKKLEIKAPTTTSTGDSVLLEMLIGA